MSITIEKMRKAGAFIDKAFPSKKHKSGELRGAFPEIGKDLKKQGKTSVDLVRELRNP